MLENVGIDDIVVGMFVTRITEQDNNVKLVSGGMVREENEISQMRNRGIREVEIDLLRSVHHKDSDELFQPTEQDVLDYQDKMKAAMDVYEQVKDRHSVFIERIASKKTINVKLVSELSSHIVDSVFDSPDALSLVTQLKQADQYILDHSINCVVLITILAKKMGMDRDTIYQCGVGALLMDIGMARLPLLLTHKFGELNDKEAEMMRRHVEWAHHIAEQADCLSEVSLDIIRQHHERLDGSGYPQGLHGKDISQFARMAAIVDTYDALTTDRPFRKGMTSAQAFRVMREEEAECLDQTLLNEFIRHMGTYPIGTMVRLSNGLMAVVMRQSSKSPDRPMVMAVFDFNRKVDIQPRAINLIRETDIDIIDAVEANEANENVVSFVRGH